MSKELALAGVTLAGGATFVVHPHAAIGAAVGCCFFLAMPWAGMENTFDTSQAGRENAFTLSQADKESRFQAFLVSSGYVSKGDYASGVVLE